MGRSNKIGWMDGWMMVHKLLYNNELIGPRNWIASTHSRKARETEKKKQRTRREGRKKNKGEKDTTQLEIEIED